MLTVGAGNLYKGNTNRSLRFVLCPKIKLYMLVYREREESSFFNMAFYTSDDDIEQNDLIKEKCVCDADQARWALFFK